MTSNAVTPPKEEVNFVGKEKGKDSKKQPSGSSKQKKNRLPGKKKPEADPRNTRSPKTVAPNSSETNAQHTILHLL